MKWNASCLIALCLVLVSLLSLPAGAVAPEAPPARLQARLAERFVSDSSAHVTFLVMLDQQPTIPPATLHATLTERRKAVVAALQEAATRTQAPVLSAIALLQRRGDISDVQTLWVVNALVVTGNLHAASTLARRTDIRTVASSDVVPLAEATVLNDQMALSSEAWNLELIRAPEAWALGADGTGAVVGSIDSGVDWTHPALRHQFRGYDPVSPTFAGNWIDVANGKVTPYDIDGHGTHTVGTMVGRDPGTGTTTGVAPGAKWIAARAFAPVGSNGATIAHDHWLLAAGQWMMAPTDQFGVAHPEWAPDVINNSWGSVESSKNEFFLPMVQNWIAAGIFPVFAAGNSGPSSGTISVPGDYPQSYAVASVNSSKALAAASSRGPSKYSNVQKPDASAPGVAILSAEKGATDGTGGTGYVTMSGTSMAAPHVAGVVALMRSIQPDRALLPVEAIRNALNSTAVPLTSGAYPTSPNVGFGRGLIDAVEAVKVATFTGTLTGTLTDAVTGHPLPGAVSYSPGTLTTTAGVDGSFSLTLPPGTYTVTASHYAFYPQEREVVFVNGQTVVQDIALSPIARGTLTGQVKDPVTGIPIAGARVSLAEDPRMTPAVSDQAGQFVLQPLIGDYRVVVQAPGYSPRSFTQTITDGATTTRLVELWAMVNLPDDWPTDRGAPTHTGSTEVPLTPPLTFKWANPGFITNGTRPVVAGGMVFAIGTTELGALSVATGELLWTRPLVTFGSGPVYDAGSVYASGTDGMVHAFGAATGDPIWSAQTGGRLDRAPAVASGRLFVVTSTPTQGIYLKAYLTSTGELLWQRPLKGGESQPAVIGNVVYISGGGPKTYALNAATGAEIWFRDGCNLCSRSGGQTPVIAGGLLLELTAYNNTLRARSLSDGSHVWSAIGLKGTPAVHDNVVYTERTEGGVSARNLNTGAELWVAPGPSGPFLISRDYLYGPGMEILHIPTQTLLPMTLPSAGASVAGNGILVISASSRLIAYEPSMLYGTLVLEGRSTHDGLQVELHQDQLLYSTTTSGDGSFSFGQITPGTYTLKVSTPGFLSISEEVTLTIGSMLNAGVAKLLTGDADGDGQITRADLDLIVAHWRSTESIYDYSQSGSVDLRDLASAALNINE